MTGTGDRRGSGEELWPQEPQQQVYLDEWGRPQTVAAPYGGVPQQPQYGYEQYQYPEQQQYAEPGYGYQQQGYQQQGYQQGYQQDYDTGQYALPEQQRYQEPAPVAEPAPVPASVRPRPAPPAPGAESVSDEFAFLDDAEESADVIDWKKFSETRGERRDERRKRLRNRIVAAGAAVVLLAGGTVGVLWANGTLFGSSATAIAASTQRTVIVVHLHDLDRNVYTALLVSDPSGGKGATVLLPSTLAVPTQGGGPSVALGGAVESQGNGATRDGINTLLGANATATWTLYTPYLQILVDLVGGIPLDANATVSKDGKTLVTPGKATVNGAAAIAYAVHREPGEGADAQLSRFGQVLAGLVQAMPQDQVSAASYVTRMGAVSDPSLPESTLGALLAALSKDAQGAHYSTRTLGVKPDGSLAPGASDLVKQLLGGTVSDKGAAPITARVAVQDATGTANRANLAGAAVDNAGFTLVPGTPKAATTRAVSSVEYTDDNRAGDAKQVAQDLGLPATAVRKVTSGLSVDVMVVLGKDYKG